MSDPRVPRGEPELWPGGAVSPQTEMWRPMQTFHVELACLNCRTGCLAATGETHESGGNVHKCNTCDTRYVVPGKPYPQRVERIDKGAQPMRGTHYAEG
jgi:hypothetical protein